jgi:hypothetical protein
MRKLRMQTVEPIYEVDQTKLNEAYNTLMNWKIYYPEDLVHYYDTLDEEEYEYVLEKKNDFPEDVQYILWGAPLVFVGKQSHLKCTNLTDEMRMSAEEKERTIFDARVDEELAKYVIPDRPRDNLDTTLASLYKRLKYDEKDLEELMNAPTRKYVAPGMRKELMLSNSEVQELQKSIEKTKNEISVCEKKIANADDYWRKLKQNEFRDQIIHKMLAV